MNYIHSHINSFIYLVIKNRIKQALKILNIKNIKKIRFGTNNSLNVDLKAQVYLLSLTNFTDSVRYKKFTVPNLIQRNALLLF